MRKLFLLLLALVLAGAVGSGCTSVPLTNRKQLAFIPNSQLSQMSATEYDKVLTSSKVAKNTPEAQMVERVGRKIADAVERYCEANGLRQEFAWEFNVIEDDDMVNAWCMPGGKVAFYTGILKLTQDEAGVATVMGHEIAHAVANHGNERMSQQMVSQLGMTALSAALQQQPEKTQGLYMAAIGAGVQFGVLLPFSREQEKEADHMGLIFMAMAGYEPSAAVKFWERMAAAGGGSPPEFLSTHPAHHTRIENLKKLVPAARAYLPPAAN